MPNLDELYRSAIRLHKEGKAREAGRAYDRLLGMRPDHAGAMHLKGVLSLQAGDYDAAIDLIERSLRIQPRHALALSNLSVAYRAKGRLLDSISALDRAIAIGPESADAWTNLAHTQMEAGRVRSAVDSARKALALKPDRIEAWYFMIFGTNYIAEFDPEMLTADARRFGEILSRGIAVPSHYENDPDPDRPIRVGLLSADFGEHPVGRFLISFLGQLDPRRIELFAYADRQRTDALSARFREVMPNWRNVGGVPDEAVRRQVADDRIDVLVDLAGVTARRLAVFAGKPAPIAFTWLGYFATTGVAQIDYVLGNRWVLPEAEEAYWIEKPWRMPDTYLCFSVPKDAGDVGALPALQSGRVTFGSFNNSSKFSDATLASWARVLEAVPNSRLILRSSARYQEGAVDEIERRLALAGIELGRVRIDPPIKDYTEHLRSYGEIDIALDPFPYNGGTTTVEALYMGVPVLVKAGDRYVAHMGESILHNVGLPDWIAPDEAAYPVLAAQMAADLPRLASVRAGLRERMLKSPLFDAPRFARNFEDAVRGMWRAWCAAQGRG